MTADISPATHPRRGRVSAILVGLLSSLARSILLTLTALLLWAALPAVWGWVPTTVQSDSMAPLIRTGDVIVAMRIAPDDLVAGRDVLVHDPDHPGHLRLHRFVRFEADGTLVTKGDANATEDSSHVRGGELVGIAVVRVPYIGLPVVWLNQHRFLPLVVGAVGLVGLIALARVGAPPRPPGPSSRSRHRAPDRASGRVVSAVALSALIVTAAMGVTAEVSTPATAGFFATTPNGSSALSASATYDCLSPSVPDSPYLLYRFSEVSGTSATDSSGNGRTGTFQGAVAREAGNCSRGNSPSIGLSGSSASVSTATSLTAPNAFTIETWFRTRSTTGGRLMGFGSSQTGTSSSTDRQLYLTANGAVMFGMTVNGTKITVASPSSYNDGAWHLATATVSAGPGPDAGVHLYVDGNQVAATPQTPSGRATTGYWRVGSDTLAGWANAPSTSVLTGSIGSAAVYPVPLGPPQIQQHFSAGQ